MLNFIRQSPRKLRLWLTAAAAILALMSVLEAGHVHGVVSGADDHCTLCQQSVALDKILTNTNLIFITAIVTTFAVKLAVVFLPRHHAHFALIRAPPTTSTSAK
jgi:hypothetical protein